VNILRNGPGSEATACGDCVSDKKGQEWLSAILLFLSLLTLYRSTFKPVSSVNTLFYRKHCKNSVITVLKDSRHRRELASMVNILRNTEFSEYY